MIQIPLSKTVEPNLEISLLKIITEEKERVSVYLKFNDISLIAQYLEFYPIIIFISCFVCCDFLLDFDFFDESFITYLFTILVAYGRHGVVWKQKIPAFPSLNSPNRLVLVKLKSLLWSQFTPMNLFCGLIDAK